jgi:transcriptional regulator with XRE-family HTH domain
MMLVALREKSDLTQAQLAERLSFTPSRLSRLEAGLTELTIDEAQQIASQIPGNEAQAYAEYLGQQWSLTERPSFKHVDREHLRKAEEGLQRLNDLESNPELKNAFLQQIRSCREALERTAGQLRSTEHPVALIGPPEVGKTTVVCTLAGLRREDGELELNEQMILQTGGGRVTISEVHVRNGSDYSISVDPCSVEEVQQFVSEFCDDLLRGAMASDERAAEGFGISAEAERAIRNMSKLTVKRTKLADGQVRREDLAQELASKVGKKEDLLVEVLTRMDLPRRNKTSITLPRDSAVAGLDWVRKTAAEINYGRHPDFSLPRRVEITVPMRVLGSEQLDVRLIDTRGVDEPSAPRRDLQAYLDDSRCVIVLCSKFGDAPNAATLAVLERAIEGGLKEAMLARGMLLVLPREGDDTKLRDNNTGEWVSGFQEGRDVKLEHIRTTMGHRGCQKLPVHFLNVRLEADRAELQQSIVTRIGEMRSRLRREIDVLLATIERLIANRKVEETKAVFLAATRPLRDWLSNGGDLAKAKAQPQSFLLSVMAGLRYVASLRASVNRKGSWYNFDYWLGLGSGTRNEAAARGAKQIEGLKVLVQSGLQNSDLEGAHDFLRFFGTELDGAANDFHKWAQDLGEAAFKAPLGDDGKYWNDCQGRWGRGPGYRDDIKQWTKVWFEDMSREERQAFIEAELQKRWKAMLAALDEKLSSGAVGVNANADVAAAAQTTE